MKLLVVRHGETEDNVEKRLAGHRDGKLTELGQKQVQLLGERLKDEKIDRVFSSDLGRARATTKAITQFHTCPIVYTEALRERNYGEFQGQPISTFRNERAASSETFEHYTPRNGESAYDVFLRASSFLNTLKLDSQKTLLVSAHSEINRYIFQYYMKLPYDVAREIPQHNACLNVFDFRGDDNFPRIIQNDIEHLESLNSKEG